MKKEKMKRLTNSEVKPHRVCKNCGTYKGKEVLKKELKEREPYRILYDYMTRKIILTNEQLEYLIDLKDNKERGVK